MIVKMRRGSAVQKGYPSETQLKLKSREIAFLHNISFSCPIVLKFCTEHGSDTAMLCAKNKTYWITNEESYGRTRFQNMWV